MALNKVKEGSNMYQFITHTWNPLAGKCPHDCGYCSTHKLLIRWPEVMKKYSGDPHLDSKAMKDSLGYHNFIFVASQNDLFASGVKATDIFDVLEYLKKFDNRYLFQTKNPNRYLDFLGWIPEDSILCTTIETNRVYPGMEKCPTPKERTDNMELLSFAFETYVTIEPIMDFDLLPMIDMIRRCRPKKVNIGADSGKNNLPEPSKDKLEQLISELKKFTIIDNKTNLNRLLI
jgi:hypothetical protein